VLSSSPDKRSTRKLVAAALLLLLSLSWLVCFMASRGGAPAKPNEQEIAIINARHEKELEQIKKDNETARPIKTLTTGS
jgi:hypothetical protein